MEFYSMEMFEIMCDCFEEVEAEENFATATEATDDFYFEGMYGECYGY